MSSVAESIIHSTATATACQIAAVEGGVLMQLEIDGQLVYVGLDPRDARAMAEQLTDAAACHEDYAAGADEPIGQTRGMA